MNLCSLFIHISKEVVFFFLFNNSFNTNTYYRPSVSAKHLRSIIMFVMEEHNKISTQWLINLLIINTKSTRLVRKLKPEPEQSLLPRARGCRTYSTFGRPRMYRQFLKRGEIVHPVGSRLQFITPHYQGCNQFLTRQAC